MNFSTTFTLTDREYFQFMYALSKTFYGDVPPQNKLKNLLLWTVLWVLVAATFFITLVLIRKNGHVPAIAGALPFLGIFAGAILVMAFQTIALSSRIRREAQQSPEFLNFTSTIDQETLNWNCGKSKYSVELSSISRVVETKSGVIVRIFTNGVFFPNRCFRDAAEKKEVVDYLRSKIV